MPSTRSTTIAEVPDFKQWCSKDGCSAADVDQLLSDLLRRGLLAELGLPQEAVRNVYYTQAGAAAALASARASVAVSAGPTGGGWDVSALQASTLVPEVLKSWLRSGSARWGLGSGGGAGGDAGATAALGGVDPRRLQVLNPVGRLFLYAPETAAPMAE